MDVSIIYVFIPIILNMEIILTIYDGFTKDHLIII
jgi:hypothetical protein